MNQIDENFESTPMCTSTHCFCNNKKCDYLHKQYGLKKWVFHLILIVIISGAIVPFASEVFCNIWFPDIALGLSTWNQFVSIILGIIATVLSIVSLIMGFKNYEDTLSVQEKHDATLSEIKNVAKDVRSVKSDLKLSMSKKNVFDESDTIGDRRQWENKNDEE